MSAFGRFPIEIFNHGICPPSMLCAADRSPSPLTMPRSMPPAAESTARLKAATSFGKLRWRRRW